MVSWVILIALFLILFLFFRARGMQHKIYAMIIIIFFLFIYITGSKIIANSDVNIKTFDGMMTAGKLYVKWVGNAIKNVGGLTGDAAKMDWSGNLT